MQCLKFSVKVTNQEYFQVHNPKHIGCMLDFVESGSKRALEYNIAASVLGSLVLLGGLQF